MSATSPNTLEVLLSGVHASSNQRQPHSLAGLGRIDEAITVFGNEYPFYKSYEEIRLELKTEVITENDLRAQIDFAKMRSGVVEAVSEALWTPQAEASPKPNANWRTQSGGFVHLGTVAIGRKGAWGFEENIEERMFDPSRLAGLLDLFDGGYFTFVQHTPSQRTPGTVVGDFVDIR